MTYKEVLDFWITKKPQARQNGKTLWLMIAKAIEKQIPKKPYFESDGYYYDELVYDIWRCPNCDCVYEVDEDYDHCPNCGQKIDWGEE